MNAVVNMSHGLPGRAVDKLLTVFAGWPGIESVTLYGSRAKGNYRPGSDIDLMIHGPGLTLSDRLRIEQQIDDLMLPWSVDLALDQDIEDPALRAHIARVGQQFYARAQ